MRPAEIRLSEARPPKIRPAEVHPAEARPPEIRPAEIRPAQVRPAEGHRDEFRVVNLELATFVCVTSIEALTHTAVLRHSDTLSDQEFGALVEETTRLIIRYLQ